MSALHAKSKPSRFWRMIERGLTACTLVCLLAAIASRLLTDHFLLTQFLYWVPLWVYGCLILGLSMLWMLTAWLHRRSAQSRVPLHLIAHALPTPRRWTRHAPLLALLTGLALLCAGWLHARAPDPLLPAPAVPGRMRIVHWNLTSPDTHTWPGVITDVPECAQADLLLLGVTMDDAQFARVMQPLATSHTIRRVRGLAVLSRYDILNLRHVTLDLNAIVAARRVNGDSPEPWYQVIYNNHAESLGISRREFDLPDPGFLIEITVLAPHGPCTLWFIDLPSNPFVSRMRIVDAVRQKIAAAELATPVAIVGDFNIPGGSASLSRLRPGFSAASSSAQVSHAGPTWPRARPLLDIDHALLHPGTVCHTYRTFDPGFSDHWGQYLTVEVPVAPASESATR